MKYLSFTHGGICLKSCAVFIGGASFSAVFYVRYFCCIDIGKKGGGNQAGSGRLKTYGC